MFNPLMHQGLRPGQVMGHGDLQWWTLAPQHMKITVRINHKVERLLESLANTGDRSDTGLVKQQLSGRCTEMKRKEKQCDADY